MVRTVPFTEHTVIRRIFPAWSVEIPISFAETFVDEDSYWHAYDAHRSVSLTSVRLTDKRGPVTARMIVRELPPMDGTPVEALPFGLVGRAVTFGAVQPARASRVLSGMLAADGRLLIVTITSEDLDWAQQIWLSIRHHTDGLPLRRGRQVRAAKQRRGR